MDLDKDSKQANALGDLYRSALFMTKGQIAQSLFFLEKAQTVLKEKITLDLKPNFSKEQHLFWAEKILDQYLLLKNLQKKTSNNNFSEA